MMTIVVPDLVSEVMGKEILFKYISVRVEEGAADSLAPETGSEMGIRVDDGDILHGFDTIDGREEVSVGVKVMDVKALL